MGTNQRFRGGGHFGFTLVELLIVIVILGILAGTAIPQYTKTVERSRQAEAIQLLGAIRGAEMRYVQEMAIYTTDSTKLDIDWPPDQDPYYFSYTIPSASATAFTVRATRRAYKKPAGVATYNVEINERGDVVRGY